MSFLSENAELGFSSLEEVIQSIQNYQPHRKVFSFHSLLNNNHKRVSLFIDLENIKFGNCSKKFEI